MKTQVSDAAFSAFANTIYDTNGLTRLIEDISLIERSLFKDKTGTISQKARDYLTGGAIAVFEDIEKAGLEPKEDQKQLQFLKDLVSYLQNLPTVRLTVAFDPTHSYLVRLNNQISGFLAAKIILDITVDESIIGGAIFEYKGKIADWTLQKNLQDELVVLVEKAYPPRQAVTTAAKA